MAKKIKPLILYMQKGWGKHTCQLCNKSIIAYNYNRHVNSKSHLRILRLNNCVQYSNDLTLKFNGKGEDEQKFIDKLTILAEKRRNGRR